MTNKLMKDGVYWCSEDWHGSPTLDIKVRLKETEKSYVLTLIEDKSRFPSGHIEMMFKDSDTVHIPKENNRTRHAMNTVDGMDNWFCIYPDRAGVPFSFNWIED